MPVYDTFVCIFLMLGIEKGASGKTGVRGITFWILDWGMRIK
jgi:hypothetical protein